MKIINLILILSILLINLAAADFDNNIKNEVNKFVTLKVPESGIISYGSLAEFSLDPKISVKAIYGEAQGYKTIAELNADYEISILKRKKAENKVNVNIIPPEKKEEETKEKEVEKIDETKLNSHTINIDGYHGNNYNVKYENGKWLYCSLTLLNNCKENMKPVKEFKEYADYIPLMKSFKDGELKNSLSGFLLEMIKLELKGKSIDVNVEGKKVILTKKKGGIKYPSDLVGPQIPQEGIYVSAEIWDNTFKDIIIGQEDGNIISQSKRYNNAVDQFYEIAKGEAQTNTKETTDKTAENKLEIENIKNYQLPKTNIKNSYPIIILSSSGTNYIVQFVNGLWKYCKTNSGTNDCSEELKVISDENELDKNSIYYNIINSLKGKGLVAGLDKILGILSLEEKNGKTVEIAVNSGNFPKIVVASKSDNNKIQEPNQNTRTIQPLILKSTSININIGDKTFKDIFIFYPENPVLKMQKSYDSALKEFITITTEQS